PLVRRWTTTRPRPTRSTPSLALDPSHQTDAELRRRRGSVTDWARGLTTENVVIVATVRGARAPSFEPDSIPLAVLQEGRAAALSSVPPARSFWFVAERQFGVASEPPPWQACVMGQPTQVLRVSAVL